MTTDEFLVSGIVILVLAIPAMVSAFSERRPPRIAGLMLLIGGALVVYAITQKPNGYALEDIPDAFTSVIGKVLR